MAAKKNTSSPEKQALIMWALLVRENAGAFQSELKPKPEKPDRDALAEQGLISWWTVGQKIWIEVTDKGWAWAGENLSAPLPAQSKASAEILQAWLAKLQTFMRARNLVLAEVLTSESVSPLNGAGSHSVTKTIHYNELRDLIRKAYFEIAGGKPNTRVFLTEIREKLSDLERSVVDEALQKMHLEEGTTLSGLDNPKEITPAIKAASLIFKGLPQYVIWITK